MNPNARIFSLKRYARTHRYRLRNLHDGYPVPPTRRIRGTRSSPGYIGSSDRFEAIIGSKGYVAADGPNLAVAMFRKSPRAMTATLRRLQTLKAQINQIGDIELGATLPMSCLDQAVRLIGVSKLHPGNQRLTTPTPKMPL